MIVTLLLVPALVASAPSASASPMTSVVEGVLDGPGFAIWKLDVSSDSAASLAMDFPYEGPMQGTVSFLHDPRGSSTLRVRGGTDVVLQAEVREQGASAHHVWPNGATRTNYWLSRLTVSGDVAYAIVWAVGINGPAPYWINTTDANASATLIASGGKESTVFITNHDLEGGSAVLADTAGGALHVERVHQGRGQLHVRHTFIGNTFSPSYAFGSSPPMKQNHIIIQNEERRWDCDDCGWYDPRTAGIPAGTYDILVHRTNAGVYWNGDGAVLAGVDIPWPAT